MSLLMISLKYPASLLLILIVTSGSPAGEKLEISNSTIVEGSQEWDWTQARTAFIPGEKPFAITTMSRTAKQGTHGYHDVYFSVSRDEGKTWSQPEAIPSLRRSRQEDGYEVVPGDLYPNYHPATGLVLVTGKTFNFENGTKENIHREKVCYSVYDPNSNQFGPLKILEMPEKDHSGQPIIAPNAGCHQVAVLSNGEVLVPVRYQRSTNNRFYVTVVARCSFDGQTLTYLEHGSEHTISKKRGLYEPSVTQFGERFFLTMRADDGAWVSVSDDGVNYTDQVPWKFDDGKLLGSENTQQHWVKAGNSLYLVYTRHGADNDHIMRHRAPLFIARVDDENLNVIRATEQILVPENHATLGNSGVCYLDEKESWVTVAEGRVTFGKRRGQNNKVILAKIKVE